MFRASVVMSLVLGSVSFASASQVPLALSPYEVVVPVLSGAPASGDRVAGQLFFDASSGSFKGIDNSGNERAMSAGAGQSLVSSGGNPMRMERLNVHATCTGVCAVDVASSAWYTSVDQISAGFYKVTFNASTFSTEPTCMVSVYSFGAAYGVEAVQATATELTFNVYDNTHSVVNAGFNVLCVGN